MTGHENRDNFATGHHLYFNVVGFTGFVNKNQAMLPKIIVASWSKSDVR